MKTYQRAGLVLALAIAAGWGCADFLSGPGLTENPNNPTQATPLQILIAVQSSAATRLEGQIARCAAVFTQQLIGSNNQQLQWCTGYAIGEGDISGAMSGFYTGGGLLGLRQIEAAAQATGDSLMEGIADVWEAYEMGTAASVWGDLPYSEAVTPGIDSPKLDTQQQIYTAVQTKLDNGIAALTVALGTASGNCAPSEGDLIYCATAVSRATQVGRWIRAAHTLKARFHLHLVERLGVAEYTAALNEALLGINEAPTTQQQAIHGQAPGDFRFFHGSTHVGRWIGAAHTLKARFHLRLVERLGVAEYTAALNEALLGINEAPTTQQQAIHGQAPGDFRFFHGSVQDFDANIWAEFLLSRQDIVAGNVLVSTLKARNDTVRLRNYFDVDAQNAFVGADQNNATVKGTCVGTCAPSLVNLSVRRAFKLTSD